MLTGKGSPCGGTHASRASLYLLGLGCSLLWTSAVVGQTPNRLYDPPVEQTGGSEQNEGFDEQLVAPEDPPAAPGELPAAPGDEQDLACGMTPGCADPMCACRTDGCNLGDPWSVSGALLGEETDGWDLGGWTQLGYHSEGNGLFNDHPNDVNLHQQWFYLGKEADGSEGLDWGFRTDLMYGVDAADTQAFGEPAPQEHWDNDWDHGIYGWALPQLYVEAAYGDWTIQGGHFYTLHGFEVVQAPDNFFYSHAYTMYNSEPFTHTGVLATYSASDNVEVYAGWTAGWDTGFDNFSDTDESDGSNFLGGFSLTPIEDLSFTYITSLGDFGVRGEGYAHSVVVDAQLTEKLNYIFHSDLVSTNTGVADDQYSINQYLLYRYNDCLASGLRAEWWKSDGNSQYEVTAGVNYRPHANFVIRPEWRYDWNPGTGEEFDTFGVDAIVLY